MADLSQIPTEHLIAIREGRFSDVPTEHLLAYKEATVATSSGGGRLVDAISGLGKSASEALGGFGKIPITPFPTAMAPTLGQHIEFAANIPRSIQDFAGATSDLIRGVEDPQTGLTPLGTMREGLEGFAPAAGRQMVRGLQGLGFPEREMPPPDVGEQIATEFGRGELKALEDPRQAVADEPMRALDVMGAFKGPRAVRGVKAARPPITGPTIARSLLPNPRPRGTRILAEALGFASGRGPGTMSEIATVKRKGGEALEAFRGAAGRKGTQKIPQAQIVDTVLNALDEGVAERAANYAEKIPEVLAAHKRGIAPGVGVDKVIDATQLGNDLVANLKPFARLKNPELFRRLMEERHIIANDPATRRFPNLENATVYDKAFELDFKHPDIASTVFRDSPSQQQHIQKVFRLILKESDTGLKNMDNQKKALSFEMKFGDDALAHKGSNARVLALRGVLRDHLGKTFDGAGNKDLSYDKLVGDFEAYTRVLEDMTSELRLNSPSKSAIIKNLQRIFKAEDEIPTALVRELERISGKPIGALVAGTSVRPFVEGSPFGVIRGAAVVATGSAAGGLGGLPILPVFVISAILSSPRAAGHIIESVTGAKMALKNIKGIGADKIDEIARAAVELNRKTRGTLTLGQAITRMSQKTGEAAEDGDIVKELQGRLKSRRLSEENTPDFSGLQRQR